MKRAFSGRPVNQPAVVIASALAELDMTVGKGTDAAKEKELKALEELSGEAEKEK